MSLLPASFELPESDRFRALSRIGEGATGVVYRAHDTKLGHSVATKALRRLDSDEIYRLKKEFRTLAELRHPNLVRLYELFVGESHCFFTMELVIGATFTDHVRGRARQTGGAAPAADFHRLREALVQLADGVEFLHAHGKVHRDLKPTNVMIDRAGRVVLLDFGLAAGLLSKESRQSREGSLAGTLAYMSPEQIAGDELSAASDWYSIGVMLFETLTGQLPGGEDSLRRILERGDRPATSPRTLVGDVPADLDAITTELLAPDPSRRASGAAILERLRDTRSWDLQRETVASDRVAKDALVGREAELAALGEAFARSRDALTLAEVVGPSGIGKSTLVESFLADLDSDVVVLRSRCHPRETVPFKALDGLIDGLARRLSHLEPSEIGSVLPRATAALVATFPVLGRVPGLAKGLDPAEASDPHERRRQAFAALRELLARLSDHCPVVLWIDDAQWGDADSASALRAICNDEAPPRALLLLSHRSESVGSGDPTAVLVDGIRELSWPVTRLELGAMERSDLRALAERWLSPRVADRSASVETVVDGAGGSPFLAIELARSLSVRGPAGEGQRHSLVELLLARVDRLDPHAREAVELLAVAAQPVEQSLLSAVLERPLDALWELADQRLLRLLPREGGTAVAIYHDALREAVTRVVDPAAKRAIHRRLAAALHTFPGRHDEARIDHLIAAGDVDHAADAAYEDAEAAAQAATFHRAASLYLKAIDLDARNCPQWLLLSKLAECLVGAGRSAEAAPRFLEAADRLERDAPADLEVLALRRKAATGYLRAGLYDEGYRVLRESYRRMGMRFAASGSGALWTIASTRARIGARRLIGRLSSVRPPRRATPVELERLELAWAAGQGSSFLDFVRAAAFQAQHADLALRIGEPRNAAKALATEALFAAFEGDGGASRCESLLLDAEGLAAECGDPGAVAHVLLMRSIGTVVLGRLRESVQIARAGEEHCHRACRGAEWEIVSFQQNLLLTLALMGDLRAVASEMARGLREADGRGDRFARSILPVGMQNIVWLAADDPREAEARVRAAVGSPFASPHPYFVYLGELARGYIDLYDGDPAAGLGRMDRLWEVLRKGHLLRLLALRSNVREIRATCAIRLAEADPSRRRRYLALASGEARAMRRERVRWLEGRADRIDGMAALLSGDEGRALALLDRAALRFERVDMGLAAAASRWRAAGLREDGAGRKAAAEAWMIEHGVVNPERMVRLF